jgi:beta-glucanase (GH16 family)
LWLGLDAGLFCFQNYEFQAYVNSRENSWTADGLLEIRPTLALPEDHPPQPWIPQPINSARLRTLNNFAFKYGRVSVRARLPVGDWLWPALWFLPERWVYGPWPLSGEIDLMESRGNRNLRNNGVHIGIEQVSTALHFGPQWNINGWPTAHGTTNWAPGFHQEMHYFDMTWTPDRIEFTFDGQHHNTIHAGTGFWDRGGFWNSGLPNPWAGATVMAPFDQEFHMIINLAIGGTFFPDSAINLPGGKPWHNSSPNPMNDFWNGRSQWLPTWNRHTRDTNFMIDYVRIWAL